MDQQFRTTRRAEREFVESLRRQVADRERERAIALSRPVRVMRDEHRDKQRAEIATMRFQQLLREERECVAGRWFWRLAIGFAVAVLVWGVCADDHVPAAAKKPRAAQAHYV